MSKTASFFLIIVALCLFVREAAAQSTGLPPQDATATSSSVPSSDASGGSALEPASAGTAPASGMVPPAASSSPTLEAMPRSIVATGTPRAVSTQTVTPVSPRPVQVQPSPVPITPKPAESIPPAPAVESAAASAPQTTGTNNMLPLAIVGSLALLLGGFFLSSRAKGKKGKKSDPCGALKQQFEASKTAYDTLTGKLTLQELLVAQLEKEIANVKERIEGEVKKYAQNVANEIKDDILEKEKTGTLKEVVNLAEDAKAAYDDLSQKYEQAKALLDILQNIQKGLADEVREREAAYNVCTQGLALVGSRTAEGEAIVLPEGSPRGKTILVDAVYVFVTAEGKIIEPMHELLETYPNRKILLTGADDTQMEKWRLRDMPYEVFTLRHDPEKTDPRYYEKMLEHFGLNKNDVVYFEHNADAVKSAQSVGITTYHYDEVKSDLEALKKFLDENL